MSVTWPTFNKIIYFDKISQPNFSLLNKKNGLQSQKIGWPILWVAHTVILTPLQHSVCTFFRSLLVHTIVCVGKECD